MPWLHFFRAEGVVVCLGADALDGDPLSRMGLDNGVLWRAAEHCIGSSASAVVLGGGGYNPWTTARLWAGFWGRLVGADVGAPLPPAAQRILACLDCDLVDPEDRREDWCSTLADTGQDVATAPKTQDL